MRPEELAPRFDRSLYGYAVFVAISVFLLIIAGGLVTSNDAGLAVPDWPLSFGQVMPEMVGGVFYEHGHRMIATAVGLLTIILAVWIQWRESRPWVRRLGWLALVAVILQGLLGGMTVLFLLPAPVSILHATLAQTFFCIVILLAVVLSRRWIQQPGDFGLLSQPGPARTGALMAATVYLQLILGATLRHTGMVGGSKGGELLTSALLAHVLGALLVSIVFLLGVLSITRQFKANSISNLAYGLFGLLLVQLCLGVGAYMVRLAVPTRVEPLPSQVLVVTSHLVVGAMLLAGSWILTLKLLQTGVRDGVAETPGLGLAGGHR